MSVLSRDVMGHFFLSDCLKIINFAAEYGNRNSYIP